MEEGAVKVGGIEEGKAVWFLGMSEKGSVVGGGLLE